MKFNLDRLFYAVFAFSIIAVVFLIGVTMTYFHAPLVRPITQGLEAGQALLEKHQTDVAYVTGDKNLRVEEAIMSGKVKKKWVKKETWNGYTLITIAYHSSAYLLDMDGNVVHRWSLPFHKVWKRPPHVKSPVPRSNIYFEAAHVFPNGDLLALYMGFGDTPYGYGLVKMNKDSKVIWKYAANAHHDFHVTSEGKIIVLTHEWVQGHLPGLEKLNYPIMADSIVTLSANGEEESKISVLEAFSKSSFKEILFQEPFNYLKWDATHANSIEVLDPDMASAFPAFKAGQLLLSLRNIDAIAVLDPTIPEIVWAYTGLWKGQHSAHFVRDGNILLFDNIGYFEKNRHFSRIIEFNPTSLKTIWSYTSTGKPIFYSYNRGRVQRLANGNTLITESLGRRVFEITPEREIVWEYQLPIIHTKIVPDLPPYKPLPKHMIGDPRYNEFTQTERNLASIILSAKRYAGGDLSFLGARSLSTKH